MATTNKPEANAIVAYAKVLRLTDRLLGVAEELRDARKKLDEAAESGERAEGAKCK